MPFIEIRSIGGAFSAEENPRVIKEITDVFSRIKGDAFADGT